MPKKNAEQRIQHTIYLPVSLYERLQQLAEREVRSLNMQIVKLLRDGMAHTDRGSGGEGNFGQR